jgi:tripartite-type tricarboxylate transporter receptor subunit TctC
MIKNFLLSIFVVAVLAFDGAVAIADPVADFYHGKRITLLISTEAGSGYDLYARLLANHLGNYIPGKPSIVPQNEPGAGGMTVANAAYNTAPRDGTVMFTLHFTLPLYQAMGGQGVRFDAAKFSGVGRLLASNVTIGVMRNSKSGVTNIADAMTREATIGSTGITSNATIYPVIMNNLLHTKFKIVPDFCRTVRHGSCLYGGLVDMEQLVLIR